jgi:hypothetical protein
MEDEMNINKTSELHLDGLSIYLYRSTLDGKLVVDIDSSELEGDDVFEPNLIPNIRIRVNEFGVEFDEFGEMVEVD